MTDRQFASWKRISKLGRDKYVLLFGVLLWGLLLTMLTSAIQYILTQNASDADAVSWRYVIARFIVFGVIGFFIANARWFKLQRKYGSGAELQPKPSRR
jgi:drug/metabolite transporter (DMT)-like permease